MKATELLVKQHRLVEELFEQFEEAEGDEQRNVFEKLAATLVAHDAIERELFYPACDEALGKEDDVLGESLVEHGVVEFSLFRADKNRRGEDFGKYVKVLKEMVEHHVKEEEKELLPKAKRELVEERLEELGEQMERRFQAVLRSDFRKALLSNLEQVLEGKTRTTKKPSGSTRATNGARAKLTTRSAPRLAKRRSASQANARKQPRREG